VCFCIVADVITALEGRNALVWPELHSPGRASSRFGPARKESAMTTETIALRPGAASAEVMNIARATLEQQGYSWTQRDDSHADAVERGADNKPGFFGRVFDTRLHMNLLVEGGSLALSKNRTLMSSIGAPGMGSGPSHTSKALETAKANIEAALVRAGLARA
jgi:hypothetical protein